MAGPPDDGYETAHVDLADRGSIDAATAGAGGVFLHLPNIFDADLAMAFLQNAVGAAQAAGVRRLVYTTSSGAPAEPTGIAMFEIRRIAQDYLARSGLDVTVLRPTVYTDSLAQPYLWQAALHQGVWLWPYLPDHRVSWISAGDQGRVVAAAFGLPGTAGATYDIGGPAVSGGQFRRHGRVGTGTRGRLRPGRAGRLRGEPARFHRSRRRQGGLRRGTAGTGSTAPNRYRSTTPGLAEREFGVTLTPLGTDLRALAAALGDGRPGRDRDLVRYRGPRAQVPLRAAHPLYRLTYDRGNHAAAHETRPP